MENGEREANHIIRILQSSVPAPTIRLHLSIFFLAPSQINMGEKNTTIMRTSCKI